METYKELRRRHQQEYDAFSDKKIFYAFNRTQFEEGRKKLHIPKGKVRSIAAGGYCHVDDYKEVIEMFKRHHDELRKAIEEDKTGKDFIADMLVYEMINHEFSYTQDLSEALRACGLTLEDVGKHENIAKGLAIAINRINKEE